MRRRDVLALGAVAALAPVPAIAAPGTFRVYVLVSPGHDCAIGYGPTPEAAWLDVEAYIRGTIERGIATNPDDWPEGLDATVAECLDDERKGGVMVCMDTPTEAEAWRAMSVLAHGEKYLIAHWRRSFPGPETDARAARIAAAEQAREAEQARRKAEEEARRHVDAGRYRREAEEREARELAELRVTDPAEAERREAFDALATALGRGLGRKSLSVDAIRRATAILSGVA
ncbi:MAG: hypothetical protein ACOZNI_13025 [Myxococcota bacterium]